MGLIKALHEECIAINSESNSKDAILREIAKLAKKSSSLKKVKEDKIYEKLCEREGLGTTGFGNMIAIPHCAIDGIDDFLVGVLVHPDGVNFDSIDGKPVKVFAFIIGPEAERNQHIHFLSAISRVLHDENVVKELIGAKNSDILRELFLMHSTGNLECDEKNETSLFHIIVQNQEYFEKIIQIISEFNDTTISVLEAKDASYYFNSLPLFHAFLTEEDREYNRVIVATVGKSFTNEVLRQISSVTGDLKKATEVKIIVQDIFFSAGSLKL